MDMYYILYLIGLLATASLLMAWFQTTLPVHVMHVFRRLGWRKNNTEFWEGLPEFASLPEDFQLWAISNIGTNTIGKYIAEWMGCPVCFSFHLSFWVSLAVATITYAFLIACPYIFLLVPVATFTYPVIVNFILKHVQH